MKYAIRYYEGCRALKDADEIIIKYTKKTSKLLDYIKEDIKENQRLIIDITLYEGNFIEDGNLSIIDVAKTLHSFLAILTSNKDEYIEKYKERNIPFFFIDRVDSLDVMNYFIDCGVSDIYIANELGFYLGDIAPYIHEKNVIIRAFPNVAQSIIEETPVISKFFIRPDDIYLYEDLIDVFEFFGSLNRQSVLMEIYKEETWSDILDLIIIGLNLDLDNRLFNPYFGEARVNCRKRCTFGKCNICKRSFTLGETLRDQLVEEYMEAKEDGNSRVNKEDLQNASASSEGLIETLP